MTLSEVRERDSLRFIRCTRITTSPSYNPNSWGGVHQMDLLYKWRHRSDLGISIFFMAFFNKIQFFSQTPGKSKTQEFWHRVDPTALVSSASNITTAAIFFTVYNHRQFGSSLPALPPPLPLLANRHCRLRCSFSCQMAACHLHSRRHACNKHHPHRAIHPCCIVPSHRHRPRTIQPPAPPIPS